MTEPDHIDRPEDHIGRPAQEAVPRRLGRWSPAAAAAVRLLLLLLSVGGTLAVLASWAGGHGGLAIRILAGDIVLILAALLLL